MTDKISGFLEVGRNDKGEIVINHPDLKPDEQGVGHIVFSPNQARNLADLLNKHASQVERDERHKREGEQRKAAEAIPVDRSARILTNGLPEEKMPDYRETDSTGMQKSYVVLSPAQTLTVRRMIWRMRSRTAPLSCVLRSQTGEGSRCRRHSSLITK